MKKLAAALAVLLPGVGFAQIPSDAGFTFYTIPGIVNASGLNSTRFVSDVAVTNPGAKDAFLMVSFVPAGGLAPQILTVPAGATTVWRNVLQGLWSSSGAGALSIGSDQKLILRARTYNTAAGGTYGVALPVYDADGFLFPGGRAHSLWVSQSADPNAGYRTNIAVLFPDADGGEATVTVYDAEGRSLGHQGYSLASAGFQQFGVGGFAGAAPVARAEIRVSRGHAAGYSVVVDNVTGDSSLFAFEALPGGIQDVLVNGVARAGGRNATFFRTDGRFFNPGSTDATVTVAFHASQTSNPSPVTRDFVIPAGKIRDVVDVLDSLLGLPVGSAGALRFRSDSAVAILCRTSNVDPAGTRPGTFGAQQKPVPLLSFLSSADEGALITGLRQNAAFRTNIGFAAGAEGASWTLTLRDKTGATLATATGGLGPFGWTQPNVQDLFPAHSIPDDAALDVKVTSGSVDVFDSSIDNASGDPVVTAIAPLPTEIPSSATIGPAGGEVRSDDGKLTLKIPAGALASPTMVSIAPVEGLAGPDETGNPMRILPDGLTFARPALLVRSYGPADLNGVALEGLSLAVSDGTSWYALTGGSIDVSRRTLTVPLDDLTPPASRQILASGAGGGWVVTGYGGYHVSPHDFLVVEGSKDICLQLYGFDVTSTGSGKREKIRMGPRHAVAARWFKDGSPVSGATSSEYCLQPPACAPSYGIAIRADWGFQSSLEVYLVVYPRNWIVEIEQYLQIEKCEGLAVPNIPVFKSGTWLKRSFTINDDLTFSATGPENSAGVLRESPTLCPYLGTDCHFTNISMGWITSGPIQSISRGYLDWVYFHVKVQFPQQAVPSLTWSNYTGAKNCEDHISLFPGIDSVPRTEEWPLWKAPKGWGFDPRAVKGPFTVIPQVASTQSFQVRILPASSPTCPR